MNSTAVLYLKHDMPGHPVLRVEWQPAVRAEWAAPPEGLDPRIGAPQVTLKKARRNSRKGWVACPFCTMKHRHFAPPPGYDGFRLRQCDKRDLLPGFENGPFGYFLNDEVAR